MKWWITPAINLVTGLVIARVTAVLTVKLALKRFYSEKWWERKSEAYGAIIEALHHVREYADTNFRFSLLGKELPPEGEKLLIENLKLAMAGLRKHRDIGSFVISGDAVTLLDKLFSELDATTNTTSWHEHLDWKLAALDGCLPEMRRLAREDLSLR